MQTLINRRQWLKSTALAAASLALSDMDVLAADARRGGGYLRLDKNENPYGISEKIRRAITVEMNRSNRYPFQDQAALQDLIAASEKVPSNCVLIGAGCTEIFSLACLLYGSDDKQVLVTEPNYFVFDRYVKQFQGKLIREPVNKRWETDFDAMARRASKSTSLVYVCNPLNPTGTVVDPVRLRKFCAEEARQSVVFVDEAYQEYVEDSRRASMVGLVREGANVIVGRTFSKAYGLAGLRVGYGIGAPERIAEMRRIHEDLLPVNRLGIAAARAAYADADYIALTRQRNAKMRARFYEVLEKLGYRSIPDSQTNFVTFRATGGEKRLMADLRELYSIHVHPSHFFGKDWLRVSMGTPEDMDLIAAALKELS